MAESQKRRLAKMELDVVADDLEDAYWNYAGSSETNGHWKMRQAIIEAFNAVREVAYLASIPVKDWD